VIRSVRFAKRAFDLLASSTLLCVSAPLFPLIGLLVRLDSKGPLLFRQRRAGELLGPNTNGDHGFRFVEFEMYKFRTMRVDAEKYTGPVLAEENDPRVTRVGRFLRRTRLDELPQLWNVLVGQMSLIGPRPERPEMLHNLALAIPFFEERMRSVRPGITGLAQVHLNYTGQPPDDSELMPYLEALTNPFKLDGAEDADADGMRVKLLYDLAYVASLEGFRSFLRTELGVLAKTPLVMLRGLGR
jgi:lipopolysaccharide/colanic/teichoic acid biosynthesis glycosyltransferase